MHTAYASISTHTYTHMHACTLMQTFEALMRVGISEKVAKETTDGNFDHLPANAPKQLNVYRMNTLKSVGVPDPPGALEHFRSTGI